MRQLIPWYRALSIKHKLEVLAALATVVATLLLIYEKLVNDPPKKVENSVATVKEASIDPLQKHDAPKSKVSNDTPTPNSNAVTTGSASPAVSGTKGNVSIQYK